MDDQHQDDIPDWLRPLYDQPGSSQPAAQPGGAQPPVPDWLQYAQPVSGAGQPPAARSRAGSQPVTIAMFHLENPPSAALARHLDPQRILADNIHLSACYKVITEAEKQITRFVGQTSSLLMPENISVYNLREVSGLIKKYPVQLATLIVDTFMLATGEIDNCPSEVRQKAIVGVAQRIVDAQQQTRSVDEGAQNAVASLLDILVTVDTASASMQRKIQLHARKFFLASVAQPDPDKIRDGLKGSSWF